MCISTSAVESACMRQPAQYTPTSSNTFSILVENTISGAAVFSSALLLHQSGMLPPLYSISFTVHYKSHHVLHLNNMENREALLN